MAFTLEFFANERYELLKLLSENQVTIKDEMYINLSQQEIADMAHVTKMKANKILNELIDENFLALYNNKRGKYIITAKGIKVLKLFQKKNNG